MKRALIGGGGHAREVMLQMGENIPMYVDDQYLTENTRPLSSLNFDEYEIMIAVGDSKQREKIVKSLPKEAKYFTFIHPTAIVALDTTIGEGSFIGAYSIITTNITIGRHSILNRINQIGHDCIIDDYLSMMPGSIISGNCKLGNCVYIGTNASIKEKITICDNVIIGLNAGVVKNIYNQGTYVGVPAKLIN